MEKLIEHYVLKWHTSQLYIHLKKTRNSYFCVTSLVTQNQKSLVNVCLMKIVKSTVTKKVILHFNNLGEENF